MTKKDFQGLYYKLGVILPHSLRNFLDRCIVKLLIVQEKKSMYKKISSLPVFYQSSLSNIYHCCVQRTASTWFKKFLSDPIVYQYSGLKPYDARWCGVRMNHYKTRYYKTPFPERTLITALYIDFINFQKMPKNSNYKAFFVMRDPRDIVVSGYFSLLYSHNPMGDVLLLRKKLRSLSQEDGLIYVIKYYHNIGLFDALYSWYKAKNLKKIFIVKYEDFVRNKYYTIKKILEHCDIQIPAAKIDGLLSKYSFSKMRGKEAEIEDKLSHYRKGQPGDWRKYFTSKVLNVFMETTGSLIKDLGYED